LPAITIVGCMLRILALVNNSPIEMDGIEYTRIGNAFSIGHFRDGLNSVFPPGYPFVIGLFHAIVPDFELAGRLVSVVFGTFLICLSFFFGRKALKDDRKALFLSFLVAFHPYLIRYSGQVLSESLTTFVFTLALFSFYVGWQEHRRLLIAAAGFCLVLAYLTRPEYLIFYVPLIVVLLMGRRVVDSLLLLLPIFVLGSLYVLYLHSHTGLWIISNKAMRSPFVSPSTYFTNIPFVSYYFFIALSPLYFVLTIIGFGKISTPYRHLLLLLLIFHIFSLALVGNYTQRYSVEFVPICMIFAVEGVYLAVEYFARIFRGRRAYQVIILLIIGALFHAYTPVRLDRALQKEAGLFLSAHDPGSTVTARLPLVAFYAKGSNVDLLSEMSGKKTAEQLDKVLAERRVKYLVVDEELENELPFLSDYVSNRSPVVALGDKTTFVRVYRMF
jgi:4-amino-4-deoxy-L-arabinose transferase-like glycosyltransferase